MLKIWGRQNSSNVKKALWAAQELNLAYERFDAGGLFGGLDDPAYRALNPNGLVPLLQDGDTVLWESNTIVRYLAAAHGRDSLWIEDAARRAQAEKWMDWASTTLGSHFTSMMLHRLRLPPERRDPAVAQRAVVEVGNALRVADRALAETPWLSGAAFGIGDIPLGALVYAWFNFPIARPDMPHLQDWYHRLQARPAYRSAVMIPLT